MNKELEASGMPKSPLDTLPQNQTLTFVTHKMVDGEKYAGQDIKALSFGEAESLALPLDLIVDGHLEDV
jgi:hypothetical protein